MRFTRYSYLIISERTNTKLLHLPNALASTPTSYCVWICSWCCEPWNKIVLLTHKLSLVNWCPPLYPASMDLLQHVGFGYTCKLWVNWRTTVHKHRPTTPAIYMKHRQTPHNVFTSYVKLKKNCKRSATFTVCRYLTSIIHQSTANGENF